MAENLAQLRSVLAQASARDQDAGERICAQLDFAGNLCDLHPSQAPAWQKAIKKAVAIVLEGAARDLPGAVAEAEKALAPLSQTAKSYTVYCVGHAHIDMNWMWSWPETVAVTNDTFGTVLRLMDEYPEFHFSQSQASTYALIEQHHPEMLKRIATRVREGRWEVTASHWVEGDKNLAGGESLCRHLLYTRRYLQQLFGLSPADVPIDWSPDTFGHAVTVPTYLSRGGVKYLYLHRPGTQGPKRPGAFYWQGPDGSRVLVRNDMMHGYNGVIGANLLGALMPFVRETGLPFVMFVYGVGDHGGGPTRRDVLRARDLNTWPVFPQVTMATARTFYDRLAAEGTKLPTLDCELNYEFTGCYTTQTLIKKDNRFAEKNLAAAEAAAALTWAALGEPAYPAAALVEGWRDTLFSHFHDILPGSGVHDTRTYTHGLFQKTMAMTAMTETKALRQLASQVDTSSAAGGEPPALPVSRLATALGSGVGFASANGAISQSEQSSGSGHRPILLFNPTGVIREEIVEVTVWDNAYGWRTNELGRIPFAVKVADGELVPAQAVAWGGYWGHDFVRLVFPVRVDAFGYRLATVMEQVTTAVKPGAWQLGKGHHCFYAFYERSPEGLENDLIRLELDPVSGGIRSLVDKRNNVALIDAPTPILEYLVERPHGMTAWTVDHAGPPEAPKAVRITRKLSGPWKATVEVQFRIHESDFTLTYELRANDPTLYLHLSGTWFERGTSEVGVPALRLVLPLALEKAVGRYEIAFGTVDRTVNTGEEVPALNFAQISGQSGHERVGCLLLNDSKHGHSLTGNVLRTTLIRSSYDPDPLPEIGAHEMHFGLRPYSGDLAPADAIRAAQAFVNAIRTVSTDVHAGALPTTAAFAVFSPDALVVSTLKKAEDDDALVLRFYDPTGKATTASVTLNAQLLGKVVEAVEVDLLERPVAKSSAKVKGNTVTLAMPARGIASVRIQLKK